MKLVCCVCVLYAFVCLCVGEQQLSSTILHYDTLDYSSSVEKRQVGSRPSTLVLNIHFRNMSLELKPSRAVFKVGVEFSSLYNPSTFYRGKVSGDPHSQVYGHVVDGLFDGIIRTNEDEFHIEAASKYFDEPQSFHSIAYRSVDVVFPPTLCADKDVYDKLRLLQSTAEPTKEDGRRRKRQTAERFCSLLVAVDHLFLREVARNNPSTAMSEVVTLISAVQEIYTGTDFDGDSVRDNIEPIIAEIRVMDENEPGYRYGSNNIEVNDFLDLWSQEDHTGFCLALLLTYRDFANGVLGLAWVAEPPPGNRGGICEERVNLASGVRSLNTAIVTLLNFGARQPRPVSIITVAHEFGHNFGSPHDNSPRTTCITPSSSGGNYIMFSQATDGTRDNNKAFSVCSRQAISAVLQSSRSDCFTADGAFCGNGVIEGDEECDCGSRCDSVSCCTDCMLTLNSVCSPPEMCCSDVCQYLNSSVVCREVTECGEASLCPGNSGQCPARAPIPNSRLCNNDQNVCVDGECVGSLCTTVNLGECQCTGISAELCHVCCMTAGGQCVSSVTNDLGFSGELIDPGRACNNFKGYCQENHICVTVNNDDLLDDLRNIFTLNTLNKIVEFLSVYWYVPVIVVVALAIFLLLLHFTYRKRKPIKRRLSSVRRGSVRQGQQNQTDSAAVNNRNNPREISQREAMLRLRKFFPTAEVDTMTGVLQASRSESKAVRRMLDLGYPLRKLPIPQA